jgi:flavorubredoxin
MGASIAEIGPDLFRISVFASQFNLQFNHFLVRDEQPLLYHAGMRGMFPELRDAVSQLMDPAHLRWISYSHFEVDECGALNDWLAIAPDAQPAAGVVSAMVNLADFSARPARALAPGDVLETGRYRFRYHPTPHLPHGWYAGVLFEEVNKTLFCSDLFHQMGEREPEAGLEILDRTREAMGAMQQSPLMDYLPYTPHTARLLGELAAFEPRTLAVMHGSSLTNGRGAEALRALAPTLQEVFGAPVMA